MPPSLELIGYRFGRLIVLAYAGRERDAKARTFRIWICRCDCGNETRSRTGDLTSGAKRSCGCLLKEIVRRPKKPFGETHRFCDTCGEPFKRRRRAQRFCSLECSSQSFRGAGNPKWRGGRCVRKDGRALVYAPGHPGATSGSQHILEYRLIAEKKLGRLLRDDEIVHHINGDPTDNHPDNLEVISQSEHASKHAPERRDLRTGRFTPKGIQ